MHAGRVFATLGSLSRASALLQTGELASPVSLLSSTNAVNSSSCLRASTAQLLLAEPAIRSPLAPQVSHARNLWALPSSSIAAIGRESVFYLDERTACRLDEQHQPTTVFEIEQATDQEEADYCMTSVLKIRRRKMNKHKAQKRRWKMRFLRRKLGTKKNKPNQSNNNDDEDSDDSDEDFEQEVAEEEERRRRLRQAASTGPSFDVEVKKPAVSGFEQFSAPPNKPKRKLVGQHQVDFFLAYQSRNTTATEQDAETVKSTEQKTEASSSSEKPTASDSEEHKDGTTTTTKQDQEARNQEEEQQKTKETEDKKGVQTGGSEDGLQSKIPLLVVGGAVCLYLLTKFVSMQPTSTLAEFIQLLPTLDLSDTVIHVRDNKATVVTNGVSRLRFSIGDVATFERTLERAEVELGIDIQRSVPIVYSTSNFAEHLVDGLLIFSSVCFILWLSKRKPLSMNMGPFGPPSSFKIAPEKEIATRFTDVAGLDEAKQEILEFVEFLKQPERFRQLGARIPRGALLTGPPGTGKTLLARAVAGEAGVPFFSIAGTDFIEMFVGVGPQRVRQLFSVARKTQPCIVFIDEIDAVGGERFKSRNDERDSTLNQLLVEMDGFETESGVIVLASTNRHSMLDKALLRPGRFDRQIRVDLPDLAARETMYTVHLTPIALDPSLDKSDYSHRLASLSPGMSGADIANVCNEAALIAARKEHEHVTMLDFEAAIERVSSGPERKTKVIPLEEKTTIAHHEAGHAVAGWFLEHAHPLLKVSIVPRGEGILGYAKYLPKDQYLLSRHQMLDDMCVTLGGRVAEQLCFGKISSGAANDLQRVTESAYIHTVKYGMNTRIGPFNFPSQGEPGGGSLRVYSEETAKEIDEEVRSMISEAYARTTDLLTRKLDVVKELAARLLEREIIEREDLIEILGPRPFDETDKALEFYDHSKKGRTPQLETQPAQESPDSDAPSISPLPA